MTGTPERNHDHGPMRVFLGSTGLRWALVAGSIVDVVMGTGMMIWPKKFLEFAGMPEVLRDAPEFWPRYVAVFLFVLPWFYVLPAFDLSRYRGNIKGAVWGRSLGFAFYLSYYTFCGADRVFLVLGFLNLLFAVYYGMALGRLSSPTTIKS